MQIIRVLVIDDHAAVADALQLALSEGDIEVRKVTSIADGLDDLKRTSYDVVVLDYNLPGEDTATGIGQIRTISPATRVLIFSGNSDERTLRRCVEAGASGYVLKSQSLQEVVRAVRLVAEGGAVFTPTMVRSALLRTPSTGSAYGLTPRQLDVLRLLARGMGLDEIGQELFISRNTVRNHVQGVMGKLGAHSRLEAVAIALRDGVVDLP